MNLQNLQKNDDLIFYQIFLLNQVINPNYLQYINQYQIQQTTVGQQKMFENEPRVTRQQNISLDRYKQSRSPKISRISIQDDEIEYFQECQNDQNLRNYKQCRQVIFGIGKYGQMDREQCEGYQRQYICLNANLVIQSKNICFGQNANIVDCCKSQRMHNKGSLPHEQDGYFKDSLHAPQMGQYPHPWTCQMRQKHQCDQQINQRLQNIESVLLQIQNEYSKHLDVIAIGRVGRDQQIQKLCIRQLMLSVDENEDVDQGYNYNNDQDQYNYAYQKQHKIEQQYNPMCNNRNMYNIADIDMDIDTGIDAGIDAGIDTGIDTGIDACLTQPQLIDNNTYRCTNTNTNEQQQKYSNSLRIKQKQVIQEQNNRETQMYYQEWMNKQQLNKYVMNNQNNQNIGIYQKINIQNKAQIQTKFLQSQYQPQITQNYGCNPNQCPSQLPLKHSSQHSPHTTIPNSLSLPPQSKYQCYITHLRTQLQYQKHHIQSLTQTHQYTLSHLTTQLANKNQQISTLTLQLSQMEQQHNRIIQQIHENYQIKENQYKYGIEELKADVEMYNKRWMQAERKEQQAMEKYAHVRVQLESKVKECGKMSDKYDALLGKLNTYMKMLKEQSNQSGAIDEEQTQASVTSHKAKNNTQKYIKNQHTKSHPNQPTSFPYPTITHSQCNLLYEQLQQQYLQQMAHRIHIQHKQLKSQQNQINQLKYNYNILDDQLTDATFKYQNKLSQKQYKIKELEQIIQQYKNMRNNQMDIYVQEELEYLRAQVVRLERKIEGKNREIRGMLVRQDKWIWKMHYSRQKLYGRDEKIKRQNQKQRDIQLNKDMYQENSSISGQCTTAHHKKQQIQQLAQYQQYAILNTIKNMGVDGHSCQFASVFEKNYKQYMKIEERVLNETKQIKIFEENDSDRQDMGEMYKDGEKQKKNGGCKQCSRILSACMRICGQFNQFVISRNRDSRSQRKKSNEKKVHKIIKIAHKTEDDSIIHHRKMSKDDRYQMYKITNDA